MSLSVSSNAIVASILPANGSNPSYSCANNNNNMLDIPDIVGSTQLSAILGTAHILRKVLCL